MLELSRAAYNAEIIQDIHVRQQTATWTREDGSLGRQSAPRTRRQISDGYVLQTLLHWARRRRSDIAISRSHSKVGLMHAHFDLTALAVFDSRDSGIIAKTVLTT